MHRYSLCDNKTQH